MKNVHIIKKNYEFQNIISKKDSLYHKSFIICFDKKSNEFRYGISVGKKLALAFKRNYIKRQVRSMVWELLKNNIIVNKNIIIIITKSFLNNDYHQNSENLKIAFFKLNKIIEEKNVQKL